MEHKELQRMVDGAEAALLFIHGIVGTPNHFDRFLPLVPDSLSVYNLLLDGHGKGTKEFSHTSMKKWEHQVQDAIEQLSLSHDRIYVVAHSMGTLFSIEQAIQNERITKLFFLAVPIKLFIKPALLRNSFRVYRNKLDPNDEAAMAAKACYGIQPDKNPFHYLGWIPRFWELFAKIRRTRALLPLLNTPCTAYQSGKDEMVSHASVKYLKRHSGMTVVELEKSRHYYYEKDDWDLLLRDFREFVALSF